MSELRAALDGLKAMMRGQIPDMSPRSRLRWKVDDPTAQYDPLVRLSAVYDVIDDWAAALSSKDEPLDVERLAEALHGHMLAATFGERDIRAFCACGRWAETFELAEPGPEPMPHVNEFYRHYALTIAAEYAALSKETPA